MERHESTSLLVGRHRASPTGHGSQPPDGRAPEHQPAWREDFPIDWPQDRYVERRDFVKFLVLTSGAFAAGQIWIALRASWRDLRGLPPIALVTAVADVAIGGSLVFHYPAASDPCVLVRLSDSEFVAYDQKCTHLSCAVIPRFAEGTLLCPCHQGVFDLRSGRNIAGPPPRPLRRIVLEIRNGSVYASGVEERLA